MAGFTTAVGLLWLSFYLHPRMTTGCGPDREVALAFLMVITTGLLSVFSGFFVSAIAFRLLEIVEKIGNPKVTTSACGDPINTLYLAPSFAKRLFRRLFSLLLTAIVAAGAVVVANKFMR